MKICVITVVVALSAGCIAPPPRRVSVAAPPASTFIAYPARAQSPQQIERDRYECHAWAVQQSGFDPSRQLPGERAIVKPATAPGTGLAIGTIAGALFGAAITGPRASAAGAILGGVAGAAIGASSDANAQARASAEQAQIDQSQSQDTAKTKSYERALGVCLEGCGYAVG